MNSIIFVDFINVYTYIYLIFENINNCLTLLYDIYFHNIASDKNKLKDKYIVIQL